MDGSRVAPTARDAVVAQEGDAELSADEAFLLGCWSHSLLPHSPFWIIGLKPEGEGNGDLRPAQEPALQVRKRRPSRRRFMRPRMPFNDDARRQELVDEHSRALFRSLLLSIARRTSCLLVAIRLVSCLHTPCLLVAEQACGGSGGGGGGLGLALGVRFCVLVVVMMRR
jgi:hypothetical protein